MKKLFTLIELIVVIVVLGILAAIVIPNVSNVQDDSRTAAIESNGRNLQTAIDTYRLTYHGDYPTVNNELPVLGHSKQLDFSKLNPAYLRNLPKLGLYWVDHNGAVIHSDTDMPNGFVKEGIQLSWKEPAIGQASAYKIYGTSIPVEGAAKKPLITFIKEVDSTEYSLSGEEAKYEGYLLSSISVKGFESPAIGAGINYEGYVPVSPDTNTEDGAGKEETIPKVTPTTVGESSYFAKLEGTIDGGLTSVFQNGKNIDIFYQSYSNLFKETLTADGEQISRNQITNYTGIFQHSISNIDSNGNRYLFRTDAKIYRINPDNKAEVVADLSPDLLAYTFNKVTKPGIALEGDTLYLSYNREHSGTRVYLSTYSLSENKLMTKVQGVTPILNGIDKIQIVLTEDYVYTSSLSYYSESQPANYVIQWDKKTGKLIKYETIPYERINLKNPFLFKDTNDGIWVTYTRSYMDGNPVKLYKLNLTPQLNGFSETVTFPDTTMTRPLGIYTNSDGSIDIIGIERNSILTKSRFK